MGSSTSIDAVVLSALRDVMARASRSIAERIAEFSAAELENQLALAAGSRRGRRPRLKARLRRPREEITRWVTDRRARRVPTFVVEMTGGLSTKKKIVARFGENVAFEKGKPLPPERAATEPASTARVVKAKPPRVRKAGKAA